MKLNNLQVLRGISAILVCCFHFKNDFNIGNHTFGNLLFSKGSIGVPIFFVISGFIMVYTTKKINFKSPTIQICKDFLLKRIIRIIPLYFLLTIAWILLGGTISYYFSGEGWVRLYKSFLFIPTKSFPVLYLGWSLNYEVFFYLIFAISFFFKQYRYYFVLLFFIILLFFNSTLGTHSDWFKMITSPINLYFLFGILLGIFIEKIKAPSIVVYAFICFSLISFALFMMDVFFQNGYLAYVIVFILVFSFLLADFNLKIIPPKFLIFLGDISYSIYLTHPFTEIFFRHFKVEGLLNYIYFPFKILIIIIVATLTYYLIEKKITQKLSKIFIKS